MKTAVGLNRADAEPAWRFPDGQWRTDGGTIEPSDERKVGAPSLLKQPICDDSSFELEFLPKPGPGVRASESMEWAQTQWGGVRPC